MVHSLVKIFGLMLMIVVGSFGVWKYYDHTSAQRQIAKLEEKNQQLETIVARLGSEKRVADVLVTGQKVIDGKTHTTVLFVESGRNGQDLTPRSFTVIGKTIHVDAMVLKFESNFVKENDPLRGHSIALFKKVYGDAQKPEDGFDIDPPGTIPEVYRGSDPKLSEFERELWVNFWKLLEDENYRKEKGVRVAQGEGLWWPPEPKKLYTLSIEADGGLSLASRPMEPIYQELLKSFSSARD